MTETFECPFCLRRKADADRDGQTFFGEPVCLACRATFARCATCDGTALPHHERHRDGAIYCPVHDPTPPRSNRMRTKRHPAAVAADQLDAECADRMARDRD